MADNYNIYRNCEQCQGTGKITINDEYYDPGPPEDVECPKCGGDGKILWGIMEEEEI